MEIFIAKKKINRYILDIIGIFTMLTLTVISLSLLEETILLQLLHLNYTMVFY